MAKPNVDVPPPASSAVMSLPQPPLRNAEEYLKAYTGYVYTAVSAIAQEVASIDMHLYKATFTRTGPETTEIYEHPAISVLNYINPLITFYDMVEATQIYLELTGEAFWVILKQGTTPREAWLLRPDWMKIIPSPDTIIDHYEYCPGGSLLNKIVIPKENIINFKYFHPMNPYRGKGTVQSAALPFDILNFAQEYNRNFFFNSAIPSMVFSTDKPLNEATIKRFINQWQATYGGRSKSNKVAFLGNGMKVDKISQNAQELSFTDQQRLMRDDVLAVFKVPKSILGLTDDVNRANADATTLAFMERVVTPRMKKFTNTINEFFLPMFGETSLFFDFTDPAPTDTELKLKRYENALKYGWMTPNEVRAEENMEPIEGGDELPKPSQGGAFGAPNQQNPQQTPGEQTPPEGTQQTPPGKTALGSLPVLGKYFTKKEIKQVAEPTKEQDQEVKKKKIKHMVRIPVKRPEELNREELTKELVGPLTELVGQFLKEEKFEAKKKAAQKKEGRKENVVFSEEQKVAYWKQFIQHVTKRESQLRQHAVDLFREQEKLILENLDSDVKLWRVDQRKGKESSVIPSVAELSTIWNRVWAEAVKEIFIEQGDYTLDFLGVGGHIDLTTKFAVAYLHQYGGQLIKEINQTTREKLMATLGEGFKNGESIDELKKRVKDTFKEATIDRAEMIARTEALKASNTATVEAYRQSGVVKAKEWLTERDQRTCEWCGEMDGKTIGLDRAYFHEGDTFEVNGQSLKIDFIDVGEPPLHPNCRCTTIPILINE